MVLFQPDKRSASSAKRDYALYWFQPDYDPEVIKKTEALTQRDRYGQHAGNRETSMVAAIVPDLVHPEKAKLQSGVDLGRLKNLPSVYSRIWWYVRYPNHYSEDGMKANAQAGKLILNSVVEQFVKSIQDIKADNNVTELQNQFFEEDENPLDTKQ